nr:hypothetical protein B0A51_16000 [Rachicladosporium sp. CCFEE 5018]
MQAGSASRDSFSRFLLKINTSMAANVRKITITHPDLFDPPRTHRREQEFWDSIVLIEQGDCPEAYKIGFGRSNWSRQVSRSAHQVLERLGTLRNLRFILPRFAEVERSVLSLPIDTTGFKNLSITFTSLGVPLEERMKPFWLYEDERMAEIGRTSWAQEIVESSENTAWCWEYIEADDRGFYAAIDGTRSYQHIPVQRAEDDRLKQMMQ